MTKKVIPDTKSEMVQINRDQYEEVVRYESQVKGAAKADLEQEYDVSSRRSEKVIRWMRDMGPAIRQGYVEVLDVGAGAALHRQKLMDILQANYTGIEMIPELAYVNKQLGIHWMHATDMPSEWNERFDYAYICQVFEHQPNPEDFLAAVRRVLKPGGAIGHLTPHVLPFPDADPSHVTEKTIDQWIMFYGHNGFEVAHSELDRMDGAPEGCHLVAVKR